MREKTYVYTFLRRMLVIFTRIGRLGALLANDAKLFGREDGLPLRFGFLNLVRGRRSAIACTTAASEDAHFGFCGRGEEATDQGNTGEGLVGDAIRK